MKNKILLLLLTLVPFLAGCQNQNLIIEQLEFNMTFVELDLVEKKADFKIFGYPNTQEEQEILEVVQKSLDNQQINEEITINLYADVEDLTTDKDPFFGTLKYEKEKIVEDKITIPNLEEYKKIYNKK